MNPLCHYCGKPIDKDGGWAMQEYKGESIIFHSECGEMSDPDYAEFSKNLNKIMEEKHEEDI